MKISNYQIGLLVILVTFLLTESASLSKFRTPQVNKTYRKVFSFFLIIEFSNLGNLRWSQINHQKRPNYSANRSEANL